MSTQCLQEEVAACARATREVRYGRAARGFVVSIVASLALGAAPSLARAEEAPPKNYDNFRELTSTKVPVIGYGSIRFENSIEEAYEGDVSCAVTLFVYAWNEHEGGVATHRVRGYGEIVGLQADRCERGGIEPELGPDWSHPIVTAEMPLEEQHRQAVVCAEERKAKLSECPSGAERETKQVIASVGRRGTSLPWKSELTEGEEEEEAALLDKVGLHEYGERGTALEKSTACYAKEGSAPASFTKVPAGCVVITVVHPRVPLEQVFYGTLEIWNLNGFGNGLNASRWRFLAPGSLLSSEGLQGEDRLTGEVNVFGAQGVELMTAK